MPPTGAPVAAVGNAQPAAAPSDVRAYLLAFGPVVMIVLEMILYHPLRPVGELAPAIIGWAGLLLAWLDARGLKSSGRNPQRRTMWPFILLTPVGYLWRRHAVIGASLKLLFIWLGGMAVYIVILVGLSEGP